MILLWVAPPTHPQKKGKAGKMDIKIFIKHQHLHSRNLHVVYAHVPNLRWLLLHQSETAKTGNNLVGF